MAIRLKVQDNTVHLKVGAGDTVSLHASEGIPIYPAPYTGDYEVTPTEEEQTLSTNGLMMTEDVTVEAVSSTYVGSDIPQRTAEDITVSGASVTTPNGYYADGATKTVQSGSATTPTGGITANPTISVSDSGLITASVTKSESITPIVNEGYVTTGQAGTVTFSGSSTSQLSTQGASTISPTESEQTAVTSGKYTTGDIKVGAISSSYVGSGVTRRDGTDLSASGKTVSVPSGYYAENASKDVATGNIGVPYITKGTVTNNSMKLTPYYTRTAGYITDSGTYSGTQATVTASELVSGTKSITANGTGVDVTNYASVNVNVPDSIFLVTLSYDDGTDKWIPDCTYAEVRQAYLDGKTITVQTDSDAWTASADGVWFADEDDYLYYTVFHYDEDTNEVDEIQYYFDSDGVHTDYTNSFISRQTLYQPSTITPTETQQTIEPDAGTNGFTKVVVGAIPSNYVGSGVTRRTVADLSVSGAYITAPKGYYDSAVSKAVASGTTGTPTATKGAVINHSVDVTPSVTNTTGYITGATKTGQAVTVSASELVSGTKSITDNGTGIDVTNYASVDVSVSGGSPNLQTKTNIDPTTSSQTITADTGYDGLDSVQINAMPSMTLPTLTDQSATSGYTQKGTVSRMGVDQYLNIPTGYNANGAYYKINATPTGSVSVPTPIAGTGATVTVPSSNKLKLTGNYSLAPVLNTQGYIGSTTTNSVEVNLTADVTTKSAATYYASTSDQTINASQYLTGAQTIKAVSQTNLAAENIKSGTTISISNGNGNIWSVLGTYTGGGGGSGLTLLKTYAFGSFSGSSTSATDTGKSTTVTGYNDYDVLIVDVSVDTNTNGRHTSTVSMVYCTGTSAVTTKNTYAVGSNKWNSKLSSSGTGSTRQSTSAYGIYVNAATVSGSTMTLTFYYRYNSNNTGTINGTYTARVYGLKLYDLIGG